MSTDPDNLEAMQHAVLQQLRGWHAAGVQQLPLRGEIALEDFAAGPAVQRDDASQAPAIKAEPPQQPSPRAVSTSASGSLFGDANATSNRISMNTDQKREALTVLSEEVSQCMRCDELASTRTQTVFGVGNPDSRLCFFGEAPGADEDRQGEPFVGRAGKLLTDIITAGMGLTRDDVFILNVLKCRPPGNRDPQADEVANCRRYFERQFEIIQPEFICCLGRPAMMALLDTKAPLGRMRGKFHQAFGAQVLVTYHPAYLLRNPAAKADTWQDIQMLLQAMGLPVPKRKT